MEYQEYYLGWQPHFKEFPRIMFLERLNAITSVGFSNSNTLIWNHDLLSADFQFVEIISTQVIFVYAHPYLRYALSKRECEKKMQNYFLDNI